MQILPILTKATESTVPAPSRLVGIEPVSSPPNSSTDSEHSFKAFNEFMPVIEHDELIEVNVDSGDIVEEKVTAIELDQTDVAEREELSQDFELDLPEDVFQFAWDVENETNPLTINMATTVSDTEEGSAIEKPIATGKDMNAPAEQLASQTPAAKGLTPTEASVAARLNLDKLVDPQVVSLRSERPAEHMDEPPNPLFDPRINARGSVTLPQNVSTDLEDATLSTEILTVPQKGSLPDDRTQSKHVYKIFDGFVPSKIEGSTKALSRRENGQLTRDDGRAIQDQPLRVQRPAGRIAGSFSSNSQSLLPLVSLQPEIVEDFSAHLAAKDLVAEAEAVAQTRGIPTLQQIISRPELPAQISRQLVDVIQANPSKRVEIALSPAELGHVRMSIKAEDGGVIVHILAERSETLDLMRRNIDQLGQDFRSLGYNDIAFSFSEGRADPDGGGAQGDSPDTALLDLENAPEDRTPSSPLSHKTNGIDIRV